MRRATLCFLLLSAVLLLAASSFADTIVNNFTGYNNGWGAFGDTDHAIQTFGEVFTVPEGENYLKSFAYYTGEPVDPTGDIWFGAYIATWTGTKAGKLLFGHGGFWDKNIGDDMQSFLADVLVYPGQQYILFFSTSEYHGESEGSTYFSAGGRNNNLNGFAYFKNGGSFDSLFLDDWDASGLFPDLAVDFDFTTVPEPGSLVLLGTGIVGGIGVLRRKLAEQET